VFGSHYLRHLSKLRQNPGNCILNERKFLFYCAEILKNIADSSKKELKINPLELMKLVVNK